ncbi:centrosome-associated protein ALMS1 isoform X11 [Notamacropus eugenii]|uniref:centrosome-associated protein ALMS1 isoform X11 n=1 Tax=Notamacropus eugenii TaxID=9315 RepID=UPI003B6826D4
MEPPAPGPGLGAGERARGEEAAETAEQRRQRPGERPPEKEEEEQAAAGPPGGERGEMESWQSLNVEVDDSHSLLASAAGLNTRREESDLSEFPSVEEGILTVSEEDGQDRAGEASCSPLLAIEDTSDSPCIPLLASSPTHKVWNETLFQQSELEFVPLRGIPDLSEISESHSRQSQINEALFPSSSEVPSDFCDSHPSSHPRKTVEISTIPSYDTSGVYSSFPLQQECIYTNKKSASSLDTCDELSRSHGTDSVETLASHLSLRTWGTSQKLETFPTRQDQSMLEDDRRLSHSCLLPCSEKKRLGFSSSADCSFCESFNYKNLEEYKGSPKLDCLKSDESKVERLGDMCSPLFKGALSSAFMSHSLFPMSSQGQSMQNSLGPDVNSVRFPVHSDSTRTGSSGVAFHSSFQHSDRFKLDDMPKPGPKRGVDANKTMAFHEIVASIEPTASKNNSAPIQNLLGVRSDWKQTISPLNSQIEKSSPEQLTQPVYQSTPSVFPIQNFTPAPSPRSIPVTSKLQPFVSPDEKLANPNPRNFTVWKPQSPSENRDISRRTIENRLPSSNTKGTSGDLPYVSPLAQTHSPTLVKSTHYDISCNFLCPGEASQLLASFKDSTLRTNAVMKDDTNIKNPQLSESGIISSERVAEMLREAKYNMKDLPEIWESLQNDIEPPRGLTGLTDEVRDGAAEHNIPPLTFSQTKSHKSTSNSDSEPASAEPSLTNAEVKEYQDRSSQTPPEKKAHHRHCFIDSHSFVPPIPCLPVLVREPQLPCPNTLEISYKSPKITSDAWNLKFNLATDCGDVMTELDEADLRKVEEIKAHFFECGRPLDLFQDLPCPVRIKNISTLCDHVFIEAHEKDCFRTMPNEQFGGPSQDFRSSESPEMSERPSAAPWSTQCGRHAKSTLQTSQSKAWSFSRPGSHQPFPSSASESHYVNRGTPRSFHEEMETQLVGLVEPTTVSCQEPINLPSRPHSGFCSEALKCSRCFSDAPVVVQADQRESPPIVAQISATLRSKSPPPTSNRTLVNSLRKDPVLTGNQHDQVSFDLSAATKNFQEKEPPAPPTIQTTTEPQFNIKESQLSDNQDCARGLSPKSLEVSEKGVNIVAEFPSPVSPEEQAKCYQPRNVPPADNKVGPGYFSQTPLSQHKGSTAGEEDQLKQKMPSSNVADVEAESTITVHPDSPAPGGELSPTLSLSSSPKQRAISYLHITLSPKASNARLNGETLKKGQYALDSGARTRLNGSLNVNICASESTSLVPLEPAPQELAIIPLPDKKEFFNCTHHKTSQLSKSLSRQTQVNSSDLDAYSHSIGVRNTQGCGTSDHFRNADSATSLKLSSDVITQITTKGLEKATFSSEIIINSQAHNILNKPSHSPTAQLLLLPYKPSASVEMYYVPNSAEPPQYPVAKSETTLESTHSGSNDAIAPDFPPDALGTRDENMSDIVTIKHKEGIYSKKTVCEAAWTEEQNAPQENVSKSKNHLELENTTHSVFKSAQFYFHHPVHHHHDHDFFSCCEPWGRGAYLAHSRKDKDPCFNPLHETCEDEHRFSPLQTEMDYTRIERYCRNVGGNREPGAGQSLQENLNVGSKMSSVKETSKIRFSLAQTVEPSATLNELWNRFQERQKKQKPPISSSSDELSLVDRLDRLAKVLQKPTMLSLQASESAPDGCKGESMQQPRRKHQPKKKDENEYLSSHRSRWPPLSPFGLVSGDQVKLTGPRQPGLDSVSTISSDSRPSPEPADPVFESDVTAQTDGEAGPLGEVSSDMSIIDPAWIVQGRMHESPKRQQKHLSERQRGRKAANWKKTPSTSPEVRRKGMQVHQNEYEDSMVDSLVSSDSVSTVSSAWSPTPAPRKKQTVRMLNKGVQAGELEIVRNTRKHTRDFGVTFPTPNYNVTGKRVDNYMNSSSPGSNLEEKEPPTIYLWTKKPRRSKPHCSEGVSWFIPAENLRCASKKENQSSCMSGPGPSWFAPLTHTKPWRQPLREKNWQTDSRGAAQLQAMLPDLSDDKEARFVKAGLQESLERLRPDFISRSGARVKRLRLIIEERKLQRLLQRERDELFNTAEQQRESQDIAGFLSKKGYVTMRNRLITKREMVQRSKRIYEQLPEVRKRREEEQRKSAYSTYRYKAQLYKMKITNRVLGRKVPWD